MPEGKPFVCFEAKSEESSDYAASPALSHQELVARLAQKIGLRMSCERGKIVGIQNNSIYVSGREAVSLFKAARTHLLKQNHFRASFERDLQKNAEEKIGSRRRFYTNLLAEYAFQSLTGVVDPSAEIKASESRCAKVFGWFFSAYTVLFLEALDETGFEGNASLRVWDTWGGKLFRDFKQTAPEDRPTSDEQLQRTLLFKTITSQPMENVFFGFVEKDVRLLDLSPTEFKERCGDAGIELPCECEPFIAVALDMMLRKELDQNETAYLPKIQAFFHAFNLELAFQLLQKPLPRETTAVNDPGWAPAFFCNPARFRGE